MFEWMNEWLNQWTCTHLWIGINASFIYKSFFYEYNVSFAFPRLISPLWILCLLMLSITVKEVLKSQLEMWICLFLFPFSPVLLHIVWISFLNGHAYLELLCLFDEQPLCHYVVFLSTPGNIPYSQVYFVSF